jgi:hypothetical protein
MKTWHMLYGMVWLNFGAMVLSHVGGDPRLALAHAVLGAGCLGLSVVNLVTLTRTACPPRLKRIARAQVVMLVLAAVTGGVMAALAPAPVSAWLKLAHFTVAAAALAQSASVATGHDMWAGGETGTSSARAGGR